MKLRLRTEIKQTKPFASLEEEVYLALQLTARRVLEPWALFLKVRAALTPGQYNMLRVLRGAYPKGLTCTEISERLINKDPDVTRMVDRLEKRHLLRRERETKDRRVVKILITKEGLASLKPLDAAVGTMPRKLLGQLGKRRLVQLRELLAAMRAQVKEFSKDEGGRMKDE